MMIDNITQKMLQVTPERTWNIEQQHTFLINYSVDNQFFLTLDLILGVLTNTMILVLVMVKK